MNFLVLLSLSWPTVFAQFHGSPSASPVPILKQINRHNEDGSYNYGYEAADGSYKIESKFPTGEIYGKYGFFDEYGKRHETEYGATSRRGFEPIGTDINVPPAQEAPKRGANEPEDDGQYREDPSVYHTDPKYTNGERYEKRPVPTREPSRAHLKDTRDHEDIGSSGLIQPESLQPIATDSTSYTVQYR